MKLYCYDSNAFFLFQVAFDDKRKCWYALIDMGSVRRGASKLNAHLNFMVVGGTASSQMDGLSWAVAGFDGCKSAPTLAVSSSN